MCVGGKGGWEGGWGASGLEVAHESILSLLCISASTAAATYREKGETEEICIIFTGKLGTFCIF